MRKGIGIILLALVGCLPLAAQRQEPAFVPGELLVQARPGYPIGRLQDELNAAFPHIQAKLVREISAPMHVWLVRFSPVVDPYRVLEAAKSSPSTTTAQFNHIIQHRATTPNDAQFGQQWQYINTGAGGGVVDGDIDAELAWDFTTGGVTPLGDTIVACIIDDGLDLSHSDFGDNRWYNWREIPNNGLDDDGNGYADDYNGWDADNLNDNISGGWHGTPVTGIVGAKGNNNIGVAGVNWNVKLMVVVGGGNEAEAIAAYSYPLAMRKLWNQTNGANGAFVVTTNASWGIDYGQPSQAPLWCAMYDTLGKYGVLSCGATANIGIDIDVQGDLPTACPSDYLISVTNMNKSDVKVNSAGWGITTIDLGAHGEDAYTAANGNGYGGFGGTSGATPHVTGAVALLYSAPCMNMAALARSQPDSAALLMKQFILDGTDPNSSLQNITVSGGRLNLHGAILQLLSWNCSIGGCYQAFSLNATQVSDTSALLGWGALSSADSFEIQIRLLGDSAWTTSGDTAQSIWIDTLRACTAYEFRIGAHCDTSAATYSPIYTFTTDGCCEAPDGFNLSSVGVNSATVTFNSVLAANSYNLRYRAVGTSTWTLLSGLTSTTAVISGLDSCTAYAYAVQTVCDTGATAFSVADTFKTIGCEGCDQIYCSNSALDASEEWIAEVTLGALTNVTGSDNGYGDYTGLATVPVLQTFNSYSISLAPGYGLFPFPEYFQAYIDFNQDSDFNDPGELAYDAGQTVNGPVNGTLVVPGAVTTYGITRMRIVMQYNQAGQGCAQQPFDFGEVEDYCVEITQGSVGRADAAPSLFRAYPNPTQGRFSVDFTLESAGEVQLALVDATGRVVSMLSRGSLAPGQHHASFSTDGLAAGIYLLRLDDGQAVRTLKLQLIPMP